MDQILDRGTALSGQASHLIFNLEMLYFSLSIFYTWYQQCDMHITQCMGSGNEAISLSEDYTKCT